MNRFPFAFGLVLVLVGLAATIVVGITKPGNYTIGVGIINIVIGSFFIAYAFPPKTPRSPTAPSEPVRQTRPPQPFDKDDGY